MARNKDKNEVEHLKGIIRTLKSENRHLKKKLNSYGKKIRGYDQLVSDAEDDDEPPPLLKTIKAACPECNSEALDNVELGVRSMVVCRDCGYRKTTKRKT